MKGVKSVFREIDVSGGNCRSTAAVVDPLPTGDTADAGAKSADVLRLMAASPEATVGAPTAPRFNRDQRDSVKRSSAVVEGI